MQLLWLIIMTAGCLCVVFSLKWHSNSHFSVFPLTHSLLVPNLNVVYWNRPELVIFFLSQSHQVVFGCSLFKCHKLTYLLFCQDFYVPLHKTCRLLHFALLLNINTHYTLVVSDSDCVYGNGFGITALSQCFVPMCTELV